MREYSRDLAKGRLELRFTTRIRTSGNTLIVPPALDVLRGDSTSFGGVRRRLTLH